MGGTLNIATATGGTYAIDVSATDTVTDIATAINTNAPA